MSCGQYAIPCYKLYMSEYSHAVIVKLDFLTVGVRVRVRVRRTDIQSDIMQLGGTQEIKVTSTKFT